MSVHSPAFVYFFFRRLALLLASVTRRGRFQPPWPFSGFVWPATFGGGRCGRLLPLCSNQLPRPGHFLAIFYLKNGGWQIWPVSEVPWPVR